MSRPRSARMYFAFASELLQAAGRGLQLHRPSDVVHAALIFTIAQQAGSQGVDDFVPAYELATGEGLARAISLLRAGRTVWLAHRGRLRGYRPGTLRAARLERKLHVRLSALPRRRSKCRLEDLMAECDPSVPLPADMAAWEAMPPVGREC